MQVSVLYFEGCPNWQEAGRRIRTALDQTGHADTAVTFVAVQTDAEAAALGLRGSPTVLVDGEDLFPDRLPPVGLSCRIYSTSTGPAGVPDRADLVAAFRDRASPPVH